jgi:peptide deformylase
MELISHTDPILTYECKEFDFINPPFDPITFSQDIIKFMYDNNGIGLAANQVGVPYRIFAMRGHPENFVCFNPRIVNFGEEIISLDEGCLSFKNLIVKIKRPKEIRVRFNLPNGDVITKNFDGLTARTFQHELDHLNGILFYNRANRFHKERALKKWRR